MGLVVPLTSSHDLLQSFTVSHDLLRSGKVVEVSVGTFRFRVCVEPGGTGLSVDV